MSKHPFRKAIGLTFLYSFIIIGIFVLQFRNESVILKNIGQLRMSVSQTQDSTGNVFLKNTVSVTFKGISFTADDVHPALIFTKDKDQGKALTLLSWEQPTEQSFKFNFTDDTSITFAVTDSTAMANLSITAQLPQDASSLSLYYKPVSGYSVTEQSRSKQLFNSKNNSYTMSANQIQGTQIVMTKNANVAMYTRFDPTKAFTFDSIPSDSQNAGAFLYETNIKKFRTTLLSLATSAMTDTSTLTESIVSSYVAEMSSLGRYTEALSAVPDSFKNGARRTYFTSPYFNSLKTMNASLVMANENFDSMIKNAVEHSSAEVFSVKDIKDYILRNQSNSNVKALVEFISSIQDFQPSLSQATGILQTFMNLKKADSPLASALENAVNASLAAITNACSINSDELILQDKETPSSFIQSLETGVALIDYGKYFSAPEYCAGGYMIINTAFQKNPSLDLRTLAESYPLLVKNNPAYPHSLLMNSKFSESIWAWTCASNITYEENENGSEATITVSFKQGDTHYIIINGIRPFAQIEIYGLSFHTDPRFETYNSSGYVYDENTHTLLLKSRHKVSNEKIRLFFSKPRN